MSVKEKIKKKLCCISVIIFTLLNVSCLGQCGGMTYDPVPPTIPNDYDYMRQFNINSKGDYEEVVYTEMLEVGQDYYVYVFHRNTKARFSIKLASTQKEILYTNDIDNRGYYD